MWEGAEEVVAGVEDVAEEECDSISVKGVVDYNRCPLRNFMPHNFSLTIIDLKNLRILLEWSLVVNQKVAVSLGTCMHCTFMLMLCSCCEASSISSKLTD